MSREVTAPPTERDRPRLDLGLWFAFLGGATAWSVQLVLGWLLDEVIACGPAAVDRGSVLGIDVEIWLVGLTLVTAAASAAAAVVGYRRFRRAGGDEDDARGARVAFMGLTGMWSGILFLIIIVLGGIQVFAVAACAP